MTFDPFKAHLARKKKKRLEYATGDEADYHDNTC